MNDDESRVTRAPGSRRLWLIYAIVVVASAFACSPAEERAEAGEAPFPIGQTPHELVVVTTPMKADLTFSIVGLGRKAEKDDGATEWSEGFEEQVEPAREGFVRRRFRVALSNGSDRVRHYRIEIAYVDEENGETVLTRRFRRIVVPPFTRKVVSGFTPIRQDRAVRADARVTEAPED
jgi:hypothetical protein